MRMKTVFDNSKMEKTYLCEVRKAFRAVYGFAVRTNLNTAELDELKFLEDFVQGFFTKDL